MQNESVKCGAKMDERGSDFNGRLRLAGGVLLVIGLFGFVVSGYLISEINNSPDSEIPLDHKPVLLFLSQMIRGVSQIFAIVGLIGLWAPIIRGLRSGGDIPTLMVMILLTLVVTGLSGYLILTPTAASLPPNEDPSLGVFAPSDGPLSVGAFTDKQISGGKYFLFTKEGKVYETESLVLFNLIEVGKPYAVQISPDDIITDVLSANSLNP